MAPQFIFATEVVIETETETRDQRARISDHFQLWLLCEKRKKKKKNYEPKLNEMFVKMSKKKVAQNWVSDKQVY